MKKQTIIIITVLTALSLLGMIFFQVYWVNRAVNLQEKQFNHRVIVAMNNAVDKLYDNKKEKPKKFDTLNFNETINLQFEGSINKKLLDSLIKDEFAYQHIDLDFQFGILKCKESDAIMNSAHGSMKKLYNSKFKCSYAYYKKNCYNLSIFFPSLRKHLIQEAGLIIAFPFMIILIFGLCFAYVIRIIFRQKKLSEIKTDFINNMTHEFKTPISTISLASEVLLEPEIVGNKEKSMHYARMIHSENARLKNQVEQVLQMAVIDKGCLKLTIEKLDIHNIINEVIESLQLQLEEKKGQLTKAFNALSSVLPIDEFHFRNAIYNLIDNAIKYSENPAAVWVSTKNEKNGITVTVKDQGCGISSSNQKQIFEQFYRVPTGDVHDVKGFGLGLNYVKAIVDSLHGILSVKSELNKGSEFSIYLPFEITSNK